VGTTAWLGDVTLPTRNLVAADLSGESAQEHGVEVSRSDAESGVDGQLPADSGDEPARVEAVDAEQRDMVVVDQDAAGVIESPVEDDHVVNRPVRGLPRSGGSCGPGPASPG
jgi:hypothetical protein